jgi:hypothetical protein
MSIRNRDGFALISVILATVTLSILLTAYYTTTSGELSSVRATEDAASGFYSAEAGLNIRGEAIRAVFQGYARPSGTSPVDSIGCIAGNMGTGHFQCIQYNFNSRAIDTYVVEDPRNNDPNDSERMITIPPGERFAGLNAIQYRYSVISEAGATFDSRPEAILEMVFRTRLVPLFQFAAFYNKDLEILPGPNMTLGGPVHVNGNLYVNAGNTLSIDGEITVSTSDTASHGGELWRGRKDRNECAGTVRVDDANGATNPNPAITCAGGSRRMLTLAELPTWNGRIEMGLEPVTVPAAQTFAPGGMYWEQADLVVALDLRAGLSNARIIIPNRDISAGITENTALTTLVNDPTVCQANAASRSYEIDTSAGLHVEVKGPPAMAALPATAMALEWSNSFRDRRENSAVGARNGRRLMLEVDVRGLMNCMHSDPQLFDDGPSVERDLNDTSGGGLVWYFTVLGPYSANASSGYGVRLRNGANLDATIGGAPEINGLTVVSDQAIFVQGHYNLDAPEWKPASFLGDALNILSENFSTTWSAHRTAGSSPAALPTTVQAAFLGGTRTTGNTEGASQTCGNGCYNGGLENYPIFHENWGGVLFRYRGSFVSLEQPKRSTGLWVNQWYGAPNRDWGYESRFNNVANLPPLSPRFVYLLQERFVRDFTR